MGKLVKISAIFNILYGNQLDVNKQNVINGGVAFVNRGANNLGVSCKIERIKNTKPFKKGLITVSLGGSVLESYIQPDDFYTGQNIKVLEPKTELTHNQKLFYCICIKKNAYKYSAFGREANKTFNDLLVPKVADIPSWVENTKFPKTPSKEPFHNKKVSLNDREWRWFKYENVFNIEKGYYNKKPTDGPGNINEGIPFISAISVNNGVSSYYEINTIEQATKTGDDKNHDLSHKDISRRRLHYNL